MTAADDVAADGYAADVARGAEFSCIEAANDRAGDCRAADVAAGAAGHGDRAHQIFAHFEHGHFAVDVAVETCAGPWGGEIVSADRLDGEVSNRRCGGERVAGVDLAEVAVDGHSTQIDAGGVEITERGKSIAGRNRTESRLRRDCDAVDRRADAGQINFLQLL